VITSVCVCLCGRLCSRQLTNALMHGCRPNLVGTGKRKWLNFGDDPIPDVVIFSTSLNITRTFRLTERTVIGVFLQLCVV